MSKFLMAAALLMTVACSKPSPKPSPDGNATTPPPTETNEVTDGGMNHSHSGNVPESDMMTKRCPSVDGGFKLMKVKVCP